jgi:predicted DNA-binding transcriptional regulator YafY
LFSPVYYAIVPYYVTILWSIFEGRSMPEKINIYASYGQKLISLFVRLLFSGEKHSLTELARMLNCSKQTVLRLIDDLDLSYKVDLEQIREGNRHYYRIRKPQKTPSITSMSEMELALLEMCRDFTSQLLGRKLFDEVSLALMKSPVSGHPEKRGSSRYFATIRPGTIDYTAYHEIICNLIDAMKNKKVCRLTYQAIMESKPKRYNIAPLKLFSHKDAIYLHAKLIRKAGPKPDYDPLLAVHRIKNVQILNQSFTPPEDYDFEEAFNRNFGVIKEESFRVVVEFTGWAARFVSERMWSPDQKIAKKGKDGIVLEFTASSEAEVISWVLSFGAEARLMKPEDLVEQIKHQGNAIQDNYS